MNLATTILDSLAGNGGFFEYTSEPVLLSPHTYTCDVEEMINTVRSFTGDDDTFMYSNILVGIYSQKPKLPLEWHSNVLRVDEWINTPAGKTLLSWNPTHSQASILVKADIADPFDKTIETLALQRLHREKTRIYYSIRKADTLDTIDCETCDGRLFEIHEGGNITPREFGSFEDLVATVL